MRDSSVIILGLSGCLHAACQAPEPAVAPTSLAIVPSVSDEGAMTPPVVEATPEAAVGRPGLPPAAQELIQQHSEGDESVCKTLVKAPAEVEECHLDYLANGTAAIFTTVSECGGHLCDVTFHIFTEGRQPYVAESYGPVTWEISPDHQYLLRGELSEYPDVSVRTVRKNLDTGKEEHFADCLSPKLSPGGKWYLCRDIKGNVARVPVGGGAMTIIERPTIPKGERVKVGGPFSDYPGPVTFLSDTRYEYSVYTTDEEVVKHQADWVEAPSPSPGARTTPQSGSSSGP